MTTPPSPDLATLVRTHQAGVWRYLRFLGCDPALAEDLTQETFLSVWRSAFRYQGPAAAAAYLRQVARHLFLKWARQASKTSPLPDSEAAEVAWKSFEQEDGGATYLDALATCLETLAPRARQALTLRYRESRPREEVAAALGLSEDGIKSLLHRSKLLLKTCVERRVEA